MAARNQVGPLESLHRRMLEAFDELSGSFVDPREAACDVDGVAWPAIGGGELPGGIGGVVSEAELRAVRTACRQLAATNEFAINGHENRISYIVGEGHTYRATARKHAALANGALSNMTVPESLAARVQAVVDEFTRENDWPRRQEEIVRRRDRDGEVFLRFFVSADGLTRLRFVEPGQVSTPASRSGDPAASLGVLTDRDDVESVLAYFIDGQAVPAEEIQHRKGNVDGNVKRGLPLFYPVMKNLRRAEKLLRNMSVLAEIQSAITLIRKHRGGTLGGLEQFAASQADGTRTDNSTGKTTYLRRFAPGTIIDAHAGVDYDFPAAGIDASNFIAILKAELRAIASRLVMPEFMLTSDASNGNYSSTLVAEGPAVKMFARLQARQIEEDLQVMWRVVRNAIEAGRLPIETPRLVEIQAAAPSLAVRDALREAQTMRIAFEQGILSPQTWSARLGLDFDQEQENLRKSEVGNRK